MSLFEKNMKKIEGAVLNLQWCKVFLSYNFII